MVSFVPCYCGKTEVAPILGGKVVDSVIHFITEPCHYVNPLKKDAQMADIEYVDVVRRPFKVKAVQITEDNIEKLAQYIGDVKRDDDGTIYILVDRRLVPAVSKVYVGFWMTRIGKQTRVYSNRIYKQDFMAMTDSVQEWLDFLDKEAAQNDA